MNKYIPILKKLILFLNKQFPNGITELAPDGRCISIEYRLSDGGKWITDINTAGIFLGHPEDCLKFYMLGNKTMSNFELLKYIVHRIDWTAKGNPRGL